MRGGSSRWSCSWDCPRSSSTRRGRRSRAITTRTARTSPRSTLRKSSATSPHSWFGPKPAAWPAWLPFSPALLILPIPGAVPADLLLLPRRVLQGVLGRPAVVHRRRAATRLPGRALVSAHPAERSPLHAVPVGRGAPDSLRWTCGRRSGSPIPRRAPSRSASASARSCSLPTPCSSADICSAVTRMRHVVGGCVDQLSRAPLGVAGLLAA